jgi:dTDP-4-dehydrorhamnose reductase
MTSAGRIAPGELDALVDRTILITGADGMLGAAFTTILRRELPSLKLHAVGRAQLDVTDPHQACRAALLRPDVIIHCAALVDMDRCEREPDLCRRSIVGGTANIAQLTIQTGSLLVYPQSVFVFGSSPAVPLTEDVEPTPASAYGWAKLEAEHYIRSHCPRALIVRMGGFFGGEHRDKNFVGVFSRRLAGLVPALDPKIEVGDRVWQPSFTEDLAANTLLLAAGGRIGLYHMAAHGEATFAEVAREVVRALGLDSRVRVVQRPAAEFAAREAARRPLRSVIDNARLRSEGLDRQRPWRHALAEYLGRPYFRGLVEAALAGWRRAD